MQALATSKLLHDGHSAEAYAYARHMWHALQHVHIYAVGVRSLYAKCLGKHMAF